MAANRAQRISIWIIAIALAIGTIGSFVVIILANDNARMDQARATELEQQYQEDYSEYQSQLALELADATVEYKDEFIGYKKEVSEFDGDSIDDLSTKDLKVGDGDEIQEGESFHAFYIGWTPEGEIFDSSLTEDQKSLTMPFEVIPGRVITGWTEGLEGIRKGGVRELTIPAEKAYGETGSGDLIKPGMPLKFIVLVPDIKAEPPQIPDELINYYTRGVL